MGLSLSQCGHVFANSVRFMYGLYLDFVSGGALEGFAALPPGRLQVLRDGDVTEHFRMSTGACQGCILSPLFFLVALG